MNASLPTVNTNKAKVPFVRPTKPNSSSRISHSLFCTPHSVVKSYRFLLERNCNSFARADDLDVAIMKGKSHASYKVRIPDLASAVLQRVASASVTIDTQLVSSIGKGVLVFAAVAPDDTPKEVESMAAKVLKLKMWPDEAGGTV